MKSIFTLLIMGALLLFSAAANAQEYYALQHWFWGTVADAPAPAPGTAVPPDGLAANRIIHMHAPGNETNIGQFDVTDADRTYLIDINEWDTEWYHDATPRTFQSMIHRQNGYGAGPSPANANFAVVTNVQEVDNPALALGLGAGPSSTFLALRIYLQGWYNSSTATQRNGALVQAEVRGVPVGMAATPANATTVLDSVTITLNSTGQGTGLFGTLATAGPHYLLVRDWIAGAAGNHFPVITEAALPFTIDGTTTANLSEPGGLGVPGRIAVWTAGTPGSDFGPAAMFEESNGGLSLKGGDVDRNFRIQMNDSQTVGNPANWQQIVPPAAVLSDVDGNGTVGMSDTQLLSAPSNWSRRASVPTP